MIKRIAPHLTNNPIFDLDVGRLRNGSTIQNLRRWTMRLFFLTLFIVSGLVGVGLIIENTTTAYPYYGFINSLFRALEILFLVSIGVDVFLDFSCMWSAVVTNQNMSLQHLELLRLTTLPEKSYITAQHALTQLRSWRMTVIVISIRITFIILMMGMLSFSTDFWHELVETLVEAPIETLMGLLIYAVFLTVYVVEPFWRLKAATALGLWLSSRRSIVGGVLACGAGIVAIWISQGALLSTIGFMVINVGQSFEESNFLTFLYLLICELFTASVIYWHYVVIREMGLKNAAKRAYRDM